MTKMQTTITQHYYATTTWCYLPALPPEPLGSGYNEYLVAAKSYCGDVVLEVAAHAWWGGDDIGWITEKSEPLDIYAWAAWPEAPPPVRKI